MRIALLACLMLAFVVPVQAQTNLYVDSSVATGGTGASWATAYKTLNEALNVANASSSSANQYIVHVAKGTYYPTGAASATNRDSAFVIRKAGLRVYGGYPTGGGTRSIIANPTILSGDIGVANDSSDNSYHVVAIMNIQYSGSIPNDSSLIDGFLITRGHANGTGPNPNFVNYILRNAGAGVVIVSAPGRTKISNCVLQSNRAAAEGGGLFTTSSPVVSDCSFIGNWAVSGGGVFTSNSLFRPTILNSTFTGNKASTAGGAIAASGTVVVPAVTNDCTFTGNEAGSTGGAISYNGALGGPAAYNRCTFSENKAGTGGAIYQDHSSGNSSMGIIDCGFSDNAATSGNGGAVRISMGYVLWDIRNSSFTGNTAHNGAGGGLYLVASPSITSKHMKGCTFSADSAQQGGGFFCNSPINIDSSFFLLNHASLRGGGMVMEPKTMTMHRTRFQGNSAANGAGLFSRTTPPSIVSHCLFTGNSAAAHGGGIVDSAASSGLMTVHNTFAGNAAVSGRSFYSAAPSNSFNETIAWDGVGTSVTVTNNPNFFANWSLVQGGIAGTTNLSVDPLFVNPLPSTAAPTTAGNYDLSPCSPAINAGFNTILPVNGTDVAFRPRKYGPIVDIGAYEYQAPPGAQPITGPDTVCVNTSIQLSDSMVGGNWTSSNPLIATVNAGGLVSGIAPGSATITYSVTAPGCTLMSTKVITVLPAIVVPAITGDTAACVGVTKQFLNALSGGTWSSSNTSVATVNSSGQVTAGAVGTVTITYTVSNAMGCTGNSTKTFTVNPLPVVAPIGGGNSVCKDAALLLNNSTSGGIWSSSNSAVAVVDGTGLVTGVSGGTTTIHYTVTNSDGCSTQVAQPVTVNTVTRSVTQAGATLTADQAGAAYQWLDCSLGNMPVPGAIGQVFTATVNGLYSVAIEYNGCFDTSDCIAITGLGMSGPRERFEPAIDVSPNPTRGAVNVNTKHYSVDAIILTNAQGLTVYTMRPAGGKTIIDLSGYPDGVYFLKVVSSQGVATQRVVLSR